MTYALAWKNKNHVFMAADTAITTTGNLFEEPVPTIKSSFNREHFFDHNKSQKVEERVVKLFLIKNVSLGFAGDYRTAYEMARDFYQNIDLGDTPHRALEKSVFKNIIHENKHVQISVGYFDSCPKILHFDSAKGPEITEVDRIQMGNPPDKFRELTDYWLNYFEENRLESADQLTASLGIFNSYSLINDTLPFGIGGAYTGLTVGCNGGLWQPDILYIEYGGDQGKQVGVCVRHDCLVLSSPMVGQSRCLSSSFLPIHSKIMEGKYKRAIEKGKKLYKNNEYEYVIILSHENNSLVILEMKRNNKHALLWLDEFKEGDSTGTKVAIFSALQKLLKEEGTGLKFIRYVQPSVKVISEDKIIRTDIKYQ